MSRVIYKYELQPPMRLEDGGNVLVRMPAGAQVLSVGVQKVPLPLAPGFSQTKLMVWAVVNPLQVLEPQRTRLFLVLPTGETFGGVFDCRAAFVGTVQMHDNIVLHVFDLGEVST